MRASLAQVLIHQVVQHRSPAGRLPFVKVLAALHIRVCDIAARVTDHRPALLQRRVLDEVRPRRRLAAEQGNGGHHGSGGLKGGGGDDVPVHDDQHFPQGSP